MADVSNDTVLATGSSTARSLANRFADTINVKDHGAVGNGTTDDRAAFAAADTAAAGKLIHVPPGTYKFSSNITIASTLWLPPGAVLKPDNGITVTLSKVPAAEPVQVFDLSAGSTATVAFSTSAEGVVQVAWWGAVPNVSVDSTRALQAACDAAQNKVLVFPYPGQYKLTSALGIRANTRIINNRAEFKVSFTLSTSSFAIGAESGLVADCLIVEVESGYTQNNVLAIGSDSTIDRVEIRADSQQANTGNGDYGALQLQGDNTTVGYAYVNKFDFAMVVIDADHVSVERVRIESYVRGVYVSDCTFFELLSGEILVKSANGGQSAGHNGILFGTSNDVVISNLMIQDSGEHGIRVGANCSRYAFNSLQIWKPGQCGLKITGSLSERCRFIQINGLMVIDCATGSTTGTNEDGLRLEYCSNVLVTGFYLAEEDKDDSANVGILVSACELVSMSNLHILHTKSHGIYLKDESDAVVNQIYIRDAVVLLDTPDASTHGIFLESNTQILRDIIVSCCYVRGQTGYGIRVEANSSSGGVSQPVVIHGWVKNDGSGRYSEDTTDADLVDLIGSGPP